MIHRGDGFVSFRAGILRVMWTDIWMFFVLQGVWIGTDLLANRSAYSDRSLGFTLAGYLTVPLIGYLIGAGFLDASRRIVITETSISGPTGFLGERTPIDFTMIDAERSDFGRLQIRICSITGRDMKVRTGWFSREDREEMQRLLMERIEAAMTARSRVEQTARATAR